MTDQALATTNHEGLGAIERVVALGDLSKLSAEQRASYYFEVCSSLGLNPLTRPFEYLSLSGKLVLYARKDATDQLRHHRRISQEITGREMVGDLYIVTAKARTVDGRTDEEIGVVSVKGLAGDNLANALMKASTKAKRRVTLSVCGLGLLDESELETVRDAVPLEGAALAASMSGSASRLQAEIDALPASMDPDRSSASSEARLIARNIHARMKALKPTTEVEMPDDQATVQELRSFIDTYGPLIDEVERKRSVRK